MSHSSPARLSAIGLLALSLSACSWSGISTEPTSGPTARPEAGITPSALQGSPSPTTGNAAWNQPSPIAANENKNPDDKRQVAPSGTPMAKKTFTLSDLGQHDDAQSCYVAFQGSVYDITAFVPKHPDGPKPLSKCGQEIDSFSSLHSGGSFDSPQMQELLQGMKVGTLAR